jgi:hypothetical protein
VRTYASQQAVSTQRRRDARGAKAGTDIIPTGEKIVDVQIVPVELDQKPVLRQLIELYNYDFSEYDDADIGELGWYGYKHLDHYWTEEGRHPFFIRGAGKLAGLVLINQYCYVQQAPGARSIAEFFVMRKYRRRGIGWYALRRWPAA